MERSIAIAPAGPPERAGNQWGRGHPNVAMGTAVLLAYVSLSVFMVGCGLLMTRVLAHGAIGHWDDHVNAWFAAHRGSPWDQTSGYATRLANTAGIVVVAAVVTFGLLLRKWGRRAFLVLTGLVIEICVFLTSNYLVARPRPRVNHLGSTPSTFSWPSGHVAATFVLYGGIAVLITARTTRLIPRIAAWVVALSLVVAVAMSRIYRGEHHPTDAVAGLILGIAAVWAATLALRVAKGAEDGRPPAGAEPVPATAVRTRQPVPSRAESRKEASVR